MPELVIYRQATSTLTGRDTGLDVAHAADHSSMS